MAIVRDIARAWRRPRPVMRRLLAAGPNEGRALALVMAGCALVFVAQWPRLAREAHLTGTELNPLLGGSLLAWLFIAPIGLYLLAALSHLIVRLLGGRFITGYRARLALFWAFLAAAPAILLHGLVAGFIGPGPAQALVGAIWIAAFGLFWALNLSEAAWKDPA